MTNHSHNGTCSAGICDHSLDAIEKATHFSLFQYIDTENVRALNEVTAGSVTKLFKAWENRHDGQAVESDADEELLIYIPFTASIKLKTIALLGEGHADTNPSAMKAFINHDNIDFDTAVSMNAIQEWELAQDFHDREPIEYPFRVNKFSNVRSLTLYFPSNYGADKTRIEYIGLSGDATPLVKDPVITIYESAANPADHKVKDQLDVQGTVGF